MVHTVHGAVAKGAQVIGALKYPGENKEDFFSQRAHGKRLMGGIAVEKKGLEE